MKQFLLSIIAWFCISSFGHLDAQHIGDAAGNSYRIMSYNIRNGRGMDEKTDLQRVADVIKRAHPDVIALQEIDNMTKRSGGIDVLRTLADETLMYPVFAPAIQFDGGKYGVGILSKEKPLSSRYIPLPGSDERRVLLLVEFDKYVLGCTHLALTEEDRMASIPFIRGEAERLDKPFFLAGDWNDTLNSAFMNELTKDFLLLSNPEQLTFPASQPVESLDHIAVYKSADPFSVLARWVIDEPMASDHRPVMLSIRFKAKVEDIFRAKPYLQNPVNNGITIMWQTRVPAYSWVEYGTDTLNLKRARTLVDGQVICNDLHNKIRLEGLEPGKKYYYRVHSQEITLYHAYLKSFGATAVSPFYSFTLPTDDETDFTAIIFNDLHKQEAVFRALHDQVKNIPYDFVVFNGDCIDDPVTEEEALTHLNMQCETVGAENVPAFYLRGNHEIRGAFSIGLRELMDYVGDKTYGALSWGDTRIVMLDCGEDKPDDTPVYYDMNDFTQLRLDQVEFLRHELSGSAFTNAKRHVLLNHIPLYGNSDDYQPTPALWGDLLKDASFDINLSAHTHSFDYHPKGSIRNNFPVVVGGGPRMDTATVMVLRKQSNLMNLQVLNTKGETILQLDL